MLDIIPDDAPGHDLYIQDFRAMADALRRIQRQDGFWNVSLHDPSQYGGPETSGTAMFTYGMAWGVNQGLLDEETYRPVVARAWHALAEEALHDDGFLGYVQSTGKDPAAGQPVTWDRAPASRTTAWARSCWRERRCTSWWGSRQRTAMRNPRAASPGRSARRGLPGPPVP